LSSWHHTIDEHQVEIDLFDVVRVGSIRLSEARQSILIFGVRRVWIIGGAGICEGFVIVGKR
jgi:hypothetical protein